MSENNSPNINPTEVINTEETKDTEENNVIEYVPSQRPKRKRRHTKRFTKPMLFSWILLLILLVGCGIALFLVPLDNQTKYISIGVLALLLVVTAVITFRRYHSKGRKVVVAMNLIPSLLIICVGVLGVLLLKDVSPLKQQASTMKADLKTAAQQIKDEDITNARVTVETLNSDIDTIQATLNKPTWKIAEYIPIVGDQIKSVNKVVSAADTASTTIMSPLIDLLEQQPLSNLKVDDGFNVNLINSYITFMDNVFPTISDMNASLKGVDVSLTGMQEEINEYLTALDSFTSSYNKFIPALKSIIGDGSYRQYLFMAQNEAEGRANGGFPGSMTIVTVQDGILHLGDFSSITDFIPDSAGFSETATEQELSLFGGHMTYSLWDANYTPDFSRAGLMWSTGYEAQHEGQTVNGVISMTPDVIQKILSKFETSITLSDGTYLDGSNVMKVLAHDLYYQYLNEDYQTTGNDICDALFSETASQAMDIFVSNFSFSNIQKYIDIFQESANEGTFMMYMKDEAEENYMVSAGVSGNLNDNEASHTTGIYWSFNSGCKMGWFLDLNTSISEPVKNSNGSYSYTVTATIKNIFTAEDYNGAGSYILGSYNGNLDGLLHIFAPSGGSISDITTDTGLELVEDNYEGLQVFYNTNTVITPQSSLTVSYTVTTASGVNTPLTVKTAPTLTAYHS